MFSRRSFLARLSAFLGGAVAVPGLVEAAEGDRPSLASPSTGGELTCDPAKKCHMKSGVYTVTKAILDARPGDQVTVRDDRSGPRTRL